jgi:hypothetical protein
MPAGDESLMRRTGRDIRAMIERGDKPWKRRAPEVAHRSEPHAGHDPQSVGIP